MENKKNKDKERRRNERANHRIRGQKAFLIRFDTQ
jgi:hypothetical protein